MHIKSGNRIVLEDVEKQLSVKFESEVIIHASEFIGGGCINHASKIETNVGSFFLKWNAVCPADIFIREAESLAELKKAAGNYLLIPEVYASKIVDTTPGFLVQEYMQTGYSNSKTDEKLGRDLHLFINTKMKILVF